MEKEFLDYTEAFELKELGFNEPCFGYYDHQIKELDTISSEVCERLCKHDTHIKAPTYSQAFRFFREKYGLDYEITYGGKKGEYNVFIKGYIYGNNGNNPSIFSYEEAELACLKKLIEIVKEK